MLLLEARRQHTSGQGDVDFAVEKHVSIGCNVNKLSVQVAKQDPGEHPFRGPHLLRVRSGSLASMFLRFVGFHVTRNSNLNIQLNLACFNSVWQASGRQPSRQYIRDGLQLGHKRGIAHRKHSTSGTPMGHMWVTSGSRMGRNRATDGSQVVSNSAPMRVTSGSQVGHKWVTSGSQVSRQWVASGSPVGHKWITSRSPRRRTCDPPVTHL